MWIGTTCSLCLALTHIVYCMVYKRPNIFSRYVPYTLFVRWAIAWRGTSIFASMLYIYYYRGYSVYGWNPSHAMHGLPWILIGQMLNYSVYKTIGINGVYYGRELGVIPKDKPYVQGFPFIIPHPMYVGACMTIYGMLHVFGFDAYGNLIPAVWKLGFLGMGLYMFSMWVEK